MACATVNDDHTVEYLKWMCLLKVGSSDRLKRSDVNVNVNVLALTQGTKLAVNPFVLCATNSSYYLRLLHICDNEPPSLAMDTIVYYNIIL